MQAHLHQEMSGACIGCLSASCGVDRPTGRRAAKPQETVLRCMSPLLMGPSRKSSNVRISVAVGGRADIGAHGGCERQHPEGSALNAKAHPL